MARSRARAHRRGEYPADPSPATPIATRRPAPADVDCAGPCDLANERAQPGSPHLGRSRSCVSNADGSRPGCSGQNCPDPRAREVLVNRKAKQIIGGDRGRCRRESQEQVAQDIDSHRLCARSHTNGGLKCGSERPRVCSTTSALDEVGPFRIHGIRSSQCTGMPKGGMPRRSAIKQMLKGSSGMIPSSAAIDEQARRRAPWMLPAIIVRTNSSCPGTSIECGDRLARHARHATARPADRS